MNKKRNVNVDIVRTMAMLFIIIHHLSLNGLEWGQISYAFDGNEILKYNIGIVFENITIIGVNLFFLVSGYLGIKLKGEKIFALVIKLYIYTIIIQLIGVLIGFNQINIEVIKRALNPLGDYWFLLVYILIAIISPILNEIAEKMDCKAASYYFAFYFVVFGAVCFLFDSKYIGVNRGYSFISALCLYLIGSLVREEKLFRKKLENFQLGMIWVGSILVNSAISLMAVNCFQKGAIAGILIMYNNPIIIISSLSFFLMVLSMKTHNVSEKIWSFLGKNTLAVYIIHSSNKVIPYYRNIFPHFVLEQCGAGIAYLTLIPYAIMIYFVCIIIDILFEKIFGKLINVLSIWMNKKIVLFLGFFAKTI